MGIEGDNLKINKAKVDRKLREIIKADIEKEIEIGKPRFYKPDSPSYWTRIHNRTATEGAIKIFCDSIGDINPLFQNRYYAQNSVYGGLIAPPSFLNSVSQFNWQGVMFRMEKYGYTTVGFDAGAEVEWFKTIRRNDEFRVHEIPTKVIDITKEGRQVQFLLCADKIYRNQKDEIVAIIKANCFEIFVDSQEENKSVLQDSSSCKFSFEKVAEWLHLINEEEIRGAIPRFWQDVKVGEQLSPTHHIFNSSESAVFMGAIGMLRTFRNGMANYGIDGWKGSINPISGIPDFNTPHLSENLARKSGSPRIPCLCVQIESWLCRLVTNWMGDSGFLKKMSCKIRRPLLADSLAICTGKVVKKYIEGDDHLVQLSISLEDHNGECPIKDAVATVILPSNGVE